MVPTVGLRSYCEPGPVGANVDPLGLFPVRALAKLVLGVADETGGGDVTAGIVGTNGAELATVPKVGNTPIVGIVAPVLTPRLPISVDPNGIPVRAAPPGVVDDVDVGADDAVMLVEPEPHIPDVVDIPDVDDIPDDVDAPVVAIVPDVAAVAGVAVPTAIPPPSYVAVDPYIPDGEVPKVEHVVPLLGIATVPVKEGGIGLTPGDAISVEPSGIPVGGTDEPDVIPSGEVAPIVGVGVAIAATCAIATLPMKNAGRTAEINQSLMGVLGLQVALPRPAPMSLSSGMGPFGVRLSDIGQSLTGGA